MSKQFGQFNRRAFDQWRIANPWLRLGAQIVDQGLVGFATGSLLSMLFPEKAWTPTWWVTWLLFWPFVALSSQCIFLSLLKTTPGKKAFGLHIQSARPGVPLSSWQILERCTAWWLGLFTLGASWSTVLSRGDRRAWHDIAAETVVVHEETVPAYVNPLERKIGQIWAIMVSFLLISFLSISLLVNIKKLSEAPSQEDKFSSLTPSGFKQIESFSWFLLLGEFPDVAVSKLTATDQKLMSELKHFIKAKALPSSERFEYYKEHMQKNEDALCHGGQSESPECQSARLMTALLTEKSISNEVPGALPVLKVLKNLGNLHSVEEEAKFMEQQSKGALLHSAEYIALKTAQGRLLQKKGEFKKAVALLAQDVMHLDAKAMGPAEKILFDTLVTTACETQALADCDEEPLPACARLPFWREWAKGCKEKKKPSRFSSSAHALGYWWHAANKSQDFKLNDWEKSKSTFEAINKTDFEENVMAALDLALAVNSSTPHNLLERAHKLNANSPLWTWAHRQALRKYGKQWALLMRSPEQKQMAYFKLIEFGTTKRSIASDED